MKIFYFMNYMMLLPDIIKTQPDEKYQYILINNNKNGIYVDYLIQFDYQNRIINVYVWVRLHGSIKRYIIDEIDKGKESFDFFVFFSNVTFFITKIRKANDHNDLDKLISMIRENFVSNRYFRSIKTYNFLVGLQTHKRFNIKGGDPYYKIKTPKLNNGPPWDILEKQSFEKIKASWLGKETFDRIKFTRYLEIMLHSINIKNLGDKIFDLGYPPSAVLIIIDELIKDALLYQHGDIIATCRMVCEWFINKNKKESTPTLYNICLQNILEYNINTESINHLYLPDLPLDNIQIIEI